jgi:hypothetical protein
MKKINIITLVLFAGISVQAQVGNIFPAITGSTVKDKMITIPSDTKDKFTFVGMAYSKKAEQDLNSWFSPVYLKFIHKSDKPSLFASFGYDVNVFFMPMFTGVKAAAEGTAKKQALKKVDPRLFPHILFYKGELKKYKESLSFDKKDVPYFFVIDKDGKIVYQTSGAYSEDKMDEVETALDE